MTRIAAFLCLVLLACGLKAQDLELNVRVRPGTASEAFLRQGAPHQRVVGAEHLQTVDRITPLRTPGKSPAPELDGWFTLQIPAGNAAAQIAALNATGEFASVEENRTRQVHAAIPNDPAIEDQWYHARIRTFAAWDTTRGGNVVVGILDTGLDYEHPEFAGRLAVNPLEDANGNGTFEPWPDTTLIEGVPGDFDRTDGDGNGFVDDVIGYDFTDQPRSPFGGDYLFEDADPLDDNDHGTLVAGILAARDDNNYGGAGVAPDCRLKVLRCFAANGGGEDDDIARSIVYAADNGIKILNFSFGDIYPSQMMHAAIRYAYARGVVMVASAGNGTGDNLHYPSSFDEVISVSATALGFDGESEVLWPLSSFGHTVSLAAPGSGIYTTVVRDSAREEDFDFFSGTSTSAPMVTGAVAMLFAQRGPCSPQQIRGILTASADDIGTTGWDHFTGAGRLNIERALQTTGASNVQLIAPINDAGSAAATIPVVVTALDPQFSALHLEYQPGTAGEDDWISLLTDFPTQALNDTLTDWDLSALPEGEYTLRLRVDKTNGSTAEDRIRFVVDRSPSTVALAVNDFAWDNNALKYLIVYRAEDRARVELVLRETNGPREVRINNDRLTRNGFFLLDPDLVREGVTYEFFLNLINESGLASRSDTVAFTGRQQYLSQAGYDTLGYDIPMGHYLPGAYDFDRDGLQEVVMSEYDSQLGFGKLRFYEYNANEFVAADSLEIRPILIPKDVADTDGDGLLELLVSVNDSLYLAEQPTATAYPTAQTFANEGNGFFPARFADTEGNGRIDILAKDFVNYHVLRNDGNGGFTPGDSLPDVSGNYLGSVAPRALAGDFDQDGRPEVVYGDFDGDFLVYEYEDAGFGNTFIDSTDLTKSGQYLAQGDFDGDGREDIFVAVHSSLNRNEEDFEYESPYWMLRIFSGSADNVYTVRLQEYLFDIDTDGFNAITAANIDQDPEPELIFTTFPRTYIIDCPGGNCGMSWFHFGDLATHHVVGDFNGNGVNEFALGRGDKALFWEKDFNYQGPEIVAFLDGEVIGADENELYWQPSPNATSYRIWRGAISGNGSVLISPIDSTADIRYRDAGLNPDTDYLYVIDAKNPGLSPVYSDFSNAVVLRPHAPGRIDSAVAVGPRIVQLYFSVPVFADAEDKHFFVLDTSTTGASAATPIAVLASGNGSRSIALEFPTPFRTGLNALVVDTTFRDALRGPLQAPTLRPTFLYAPDTSRWAFFTRWEILSPSQAQIDFNLPMANSVLDPNRYRVLPSGQVTAVEWANAAQTAIQVSLEGAALGALGYPVSVVLTSGGAINGAPMREKDGNIATFSDFKPDLSEVYVYPNPFQAHAWFDGVRFANLTRTATVHVYDAAGRAVITLQETDGDGGLNWNLIDTWGRRVRPGIYLFRVEAPEVEEVVGKFTVLE